MTFGPETEQPRLSAADRLVLRVDDAADVWLTHPANRERAEVFPRSVRRHFVIGAHVRLRRTIQVEITRRGPERFQQLKLPDGKHFASEEDESQSRVVVTWQFAEAGEEVEG